MVVNPSDFEKIQAANATAQKANVLAAQFWRYASGMSASPEEVLGATIGVISVLLMRIPEPKRVLLLRGLYSALEANISGKDLIHVPLSSPTKNP